MKKMASVVISVVVTLIIVAVAYAGFRFYQSKGVLQKDTGSNISDYTAVFLNNGQVYFGKVYGRTASELDVRDIYYLQVNSTDASTSADLQKKSTDSKTDIVLVKLGEELHGPNDRMRINMQQVMFTESLKDDSKVVKAISDYVKK